MKNIYSKSRRRTPWDKLDDPTPLELFIRDKYLSYYNFKHPKLKETNEAVLLNAYPLTTCRYCGSSHIQKYGTTSNGLKRIMCKDCHHSSTVTTNTIFEGHKISLSEWIEFMLEIFSYESINSASRNNRNAMNTSVYWLDKLFVLLKDYQKDIVLSDEVYIDEKFYSVRSNKLVRKKDGKLPRGQSRNKYCIGVGCDTKGHVYYKIEGRGKTSDIKTNRTFINHIAKESILIHDQEKSHHVLVEKLNLKSISYNTRDLKGIEDSENPLNPVNQECKHIQMFLDSHSGFDRKNLQGFLNLLSFIRNKPSENKLEKVKRLLDMAINTPCRVKYRDER